MTEKLDETINMLAQEVGLKQLSASETGGKGAGSGLYICSFVDCEEWADSSNSGGPGSLPPPFGFNRALRWLRR